MKGQNNIGFGDTPCLQVADNIIIRGILLKPYFSILDIEMKDDQENLCSVAPTNSKYLIVIVLIIENQLCFHIQSVWITASFFRKVGQNFL